ncbi:MAG: hypothetical protein OHK0029_42810 [Armatimonadaceae bacterium]
MFAQFTAGGKKGKGEVPLWAVIVAGLCLMAFMGWLYQLNFGPPQPAPLTKEEKENRAVIADIVKRSGGDFGKVSPEDREKLKEIAGQWAGMAYKDVKEKDLGMTN